ncbi:serine O-acetyltransferase [Christiangramia gaetbulicola]|uniref:Serine acetyltransferase n=1 Tax=Christiangramia gaetbulicola TaxID=703340 RepID=A0A2T6AFQ4_9FLAO|nr:serine acetyltransferase [Christiangramia gaetbulicola]PTX42619.1 serine O-acetyltransferase [Christiangramia gaetbulicola]
MLKEKCFNLIKSDLVRYGKNNLSKLRFLSIFFRQPEFRFLVNHRLANTYSKKHPLGLITRVWYHSIRAKYGMQIQLGAQLGQGFFLNHWGPVHINHAAIIGKNCNILHGVTIGNVSRGKRKGSPTIGDEVWIGANAVVVGKIRIGNNVLIAPLTFVNFDVPDNSVVVGNPGKIVSQKGSEGYIKNKVL